MQAPTPQPRSLRRLAVRRQNEAQGLVGAGRVLRDARVWSWKLFHDRLWSLVLPVAAVAIAFVVPASVSLSPVRHAHQASGVLETLWQVQAATLALSLAVVIFIFEAVYSARPRPSIRDLAEGVRLPAIFYAGLGGLALTGMVVLGGGSGAPGGWAATWAVIWAALSGLGLIALFVTMLRDIEPDSLYNRWLARLREQVTQVIQREIFQRIAINLLNDTCQTVGIDFRPWFGNWGSTQLQSIDAQRRGVIHDINLRRLEKAGRLSKALHNARSHGDEKPAVLVYIGGVIDKGQPMMRVAPGIGRLAGLDRAFKIVAHEREAALDAALATLHDEAVRLIRNVTPGAYARIAEVYEQLLLAAPETWARYGQRFGPGVAGAVHPFALSLLDKVERPLYEELELGVMSPSREIGRAALNLPIAVAFRTIEPRAIALAHRMLRLFVAVEDGLIHAPASENRSALFGHSWLRLSEYGRAVEYLVTAEESSMEERRYGAQALQQVFEAYALLGKSFIDHDPRDSGSLREINCYLDGFIRHWDPGHDRPDEWEVQYLAGQADVDEREITRLRSELAEKQDRVSVKKELDTWRAAQRLALLSWALRRLHESRDTAYVDTVNAFIGYFGDVEGTARVLDHALEADFNNQAQWSQWIASEQPAGQANRAGIEGDLVQAFVVVALNRVIPDGPVPQIPPLEWLGSRSDDIRQAIAGVLDQECLRHALPADRLEDRGEKLAAAVEAMVRAGKEQEEHRVMSSPLDPAVVEAFRAGVTAAWESRRLVQPALTSLGMYESGEGDPPAGARWGFPPDLLPKGLFIEDGPIQGAELQATELGLRLATSEIKHYAALAHASPEVVALPDESVAQTLRRAIAEVRQHGSEVVVLVPLRWALTQALEILPAATRGGAAEPPRWALDEEARKSFLGAADGAPVFESHELSPHKVAVIAVDRFARMRQWKTEDDHDIGVLVTDYDEEAAQAVVESQPDLFRTQERTTVEARARELRKLVRLDVFEQFEIKVTDLEAARWFAVP